MLVHSAPQRHGQSDVKDRPLKCRNDVTPRPNGNETLAAPTEGISRRRSREQIFDLQISIARAIDALCKARVISWLTTLMAPAFKKLAFPPFAHQSGWPTPAYSPSIASKHD